MYNFINVEEKAHQFRRGYANSDGLGAREDPTFLTFSLDFITEPVFYEGVRLYNSPLFIDESETTEYSAIKYLMKRSRKREAELLRKFREILIYTTQNTPWFFQAVSGVKDLWTASTNTNNPYKGADKSLEIECLEAIDLRITYLADLYRKAVYDEVYMREKLPQNLRYFESDLYVSEFRNIRSIVDALDDVRSTFSERDAGEISAPQDLITEINKNVSMMKFNMHFCEFDFSESTPFDSLNVHTPEMSNNMFRILPNYWIEKHDFKLFDVPTGDAFSDISTKQEFEQRVAEHYANRGGFEPLETAVSSLQNQLGRLTDRISRIPSNIYGALEDAAQDILVGDSLGNVYNYGLDDFINAGVEDIRNAIDLFSDRVAENTLSLSDIYDELSRQSVPTTQSDIGENLGSVYDN